MILRSATTGDVEFLMALEARPEFKTFIGSWSRAAHARRMNDPDHSYLVFESPPGQSRGYAILAGLQNPHKSVELARIALDDPGKGEGRIALRLLVQQVFDDLGAHRLWLDVFDDNPRAYRAYCACGFQEEGRLREVWRQGDKYRTLIIMALLEPEYRAHAAGIKMI